MKLEIQGGPATPPEKVLRLGLVKAGESVQLCTFTPGGSREYTILTFDEAGHAYTVSSVCEKAGLNVDRYGQLIVENRFKSD